MGFNFNIQEAVREKIAPKIALMSPSGGGKTYSSLRLATGMKKELEKITGEKWSIVLGNTEGARGRYYADEFDYKIQDLVPPHEPEMYVAFIEYVEKLENVILIIDSSSHEWEGKGGCLDLHRRAGGRYQDWAKVSPRHDRFINALADAQIPIIATMRGKDQYVMSESDNGGRKKTSVEKVGVGAKQREGFEYEFTCTFMLDQKTNMATPFKDNTHIFDTEGDVKLTEKHGIKIVQWANNGADKKPTDKPSFKPEQPTETLESVLEEVNQLAQEKAKTDVEIMKKCIAFYNNNDLDYNKIIDIEVAKNLRDGLNKIK